MKLFYILLAALLAVVLGAPPKVTVPPVVVQEDGITVPADPLNLNYCCKTVSIGGTYEDVCGDLCPDRLELSYCCKTVSVSTGGVGIVDKVRDITLTLPTGWSFSASMVLPSKLATKIPA